MTEWIEVPQRTAAGIVEDDLAMNKESTEPLPATPLLGLKGPAAVVDCIPLLLGPSHLPITFPLLQARDKQSTF